MFSLKLSDKLKPNPWGLDPCFYYTYQLIFLGARLNKYTLLGVSIFGAVAGDCFSLFVIGLFLFSDLISLFFGFLFQWMSQNSEEEENHLRLRRLRKFIDSHQQSKEELIQDNQKEQREMAAANNWTLKELMRVECNN